MGGEVSAGQNNNELVDNLLLAGRLKSSLITKVFRAVDRGDYFLPEVRRNAYQNSPWKSGNLHLSAPLIYAEVMEALRLLPGLSFLNLGSGTGYLNTMVGLILGTNGINHGVEIYEDAVQYANKKLEHFKKHSEAVKEFDFCEPKFIHGNCLCLAKTTASYDRIYCGAACPEQYKPYMQNLLKVGGVLIAPINNQLLQIKRVSETIWTSQPLLPVSFASLIMPPAIFQELVIPSGVRDNTNSNIVNKNTNTTEEATDSDDNDCKDIDDISSNSSDSAESTHPENSNENNENREDEYLLETINEISDAIIKCVIVLRRERENMEREEENENNQNNEKERNERR